MAVSGDEAVIGAPAKNREQGQAYVYVRAGTSWSQQATLIDADGAAGDRLGSASALSGDTAVIGAPSKNVQQGQAYVYVGSGASWSEQAKLVASDGSPGDWFGSTAALSGDTAVDGAYGKNNNQGQAYVYVRSGTAWSEEATLGASDGATGDYFAFSVAVSGDNALVGACGKNSIQGQAYSFVLKNSNGTPCTGTAQCKSGFCGEGVCCDTACGGGVFSDCQSCLGTQTAGTDGTCGTILRVISYPCRPAVSVCDKPEFCDGMSDICPSDGVYQRADMHLCRAANFCSRDTYCDGSTGNCPPSLCVPPHF